MLLIGGLWVEMKREASLVRRAESERSGSFRGGRQGPGHGTQRSRTRLKSGIKGGLRPPVTRW